MQITNITESGANNIIMWAIASGADIKSDIPLQSFINDELFYQVTFSGINFLELFRLTQTYRDKLRIINEYPAEVPSNQDLSRLFPGQIHQNSNEYSLSETIGTSLESFMGISLQMMNDDDIISLGSARMFIPMLCRKFDVQIPVPFIDIINAIDDKESAKIFNTSYPDTLNNIVSDTTHPVNHALQILFIKATMVIKYNKRFDKYMKAIKYAPLKSCKDPAPLPDDLFKVAPLAVFRYHNVTRGEVRCSLFKPNPETTTKTLQRMKQLNTPIKIDFAVQLPIQYMQILLNTVPLDILPVSYESSMATIIEDDLVYNNYILEVDLDIEDDMHTDEMIDHLEAIENYRTRISEANKILLNTVYVTLEEAANNDEIDPSTVFAMLPSIYRAKAVVTIDLSQIDRYTNHTDPVIAKMFRQMVEKIQPIINDLNKIK